jgi:starch-binding outer membrane protein, SusD/RagB family
MTTTRTSFRALSLAALLAVAGCTDLGIEPSSTITDPFSDPRAYRAFLARVYAGLAVSGQEGPAGDPDIKGIDEGFSNYMRQYWKAQVLPTDEAVIAWGDEGLPDYH